MPEQLFQTPETTLSSLDPEAAAWRAWRLLSLGDDEDDLDEDDDLDDDFDDDDDFDEEDEDDED